MKVAAAVLVPLLTFGAYWVPHGARKAAADTVSGTWTATSRMHAARVGHTATRLDGPDCRQADPPSYCGKVLVAGGRDDTGQHSVATVELYHPATRSFSVGTVKNHIHNILTKTGAGTRAEVIAMAMRARLIADLGPPTRRAGPHQGTS